MTPPSPTEPEHRLEVEAQLLMSEGIDPTWPPFVPAPEPAPQHRKPGISEEVLIRVEALANWISQSESPQAQADGKAIQALLTWVRRARSTGRSEG